MSHFVYRNTTLDRLPMTLSGITHIAGHFTGEVCLKSNSVSNKVSHLCRINK